MTAIASNDRVHYFTSAGPGSTASGAQCLDCRWRSESFRTRAEAIAAAEAHTCPPMAA